MPTVIIHTAPSMTPEKRKNLVAEVRKTIHGVQGSTLIMPEIFLCNHKSIYPDQFLDSWVLWILLIFADKVSTCQVY